MKDETYFKIGGIIGAISGITSFVASWIYCIATYGYLLGVGLGWLPSVIVAFLAYWAIGLLWGVILMGVVMIAAYLYLLPQI